MTGRRGAGPWRLLWVLLAAVLAGCASAPPAPEDLGPPDPAWRAWARAAAALDAFRVQGKVGVRIADSAGGGGGSASIDWTQGGDAYRISLSGPLGFGALTVEGDADYALLLTRDGHDLVPGDAEQVLQARLGWSVPVHALRWWVRGLPQPGVPVSGVQVADGRTVRIEQRGWQVEPSRWTPVQGLDLPRRIRLSGPQARLTLVVRDWALLDAGVN